MFYRWGCLVEAAKGERTVLFVDDEPEILSALRRCFRHEPYLIFTAAGSPEGIAWLERASIDLVVTDERLLGMSGTEFLRKVRALSPRTSRAILTGYPGEDVIRRGLEAGADSFLYKPWNDDVLRRTVRRLLEIESSSAGGEVQFDIGGEA